MTRTMLERLDLPDAETIEALRVGKAFYTYAIARPRPGAPRDPQPIPGVDPRFPVRAVGQGELVSLVSTVSLAEFDPAALAGRLQDRPWLELLATGHQRVMTALLERYTLLPLKLCTLYTDEERIEALLTASAAQLGADLDRLEGTSEWGVKLYCDAAALAQWAEQSAPQLRQSAEAIASASPGARYILQRCLVRAAQQLAEELEHSDSEAIAAQLAQAARAARRGRRQPAEIHGRGETMTLNGSYLVGEDELDGFVAVLEQLRAQYGPRGFTLELTGPWPAYSFSGPHSDDEEA